jgi:hypothetical protein
VGLPNRAADKQGTENQHQWPDNEGRWASATGCQRSSRARRRPQMVATIPEPQGGYFKTITVRGGAGNLKVAVSPCRKDERLLKGC